MKNQSTLEHLLVEGLRRRGALDEVICHYGIESVRECCHCHSLMCEGWMYLDCWTYCSDECLLAEHPEEDIEVLNQEALGDSATYWTAWEGE